MSAVQFTWIFLTVVFIAFAIVLIAFDAINAHNVKKYYANKRLNEVEQYGNVNVRPYDYKKDGL